MRGIIMIGVYIFQLIVLGIWTQFKARQGMSWNKLELVFKITMFALLGFDLLVLFLSYVIQ